MSQDKVIKRKRGRPLEGKEKLSHCFNTRWTDDDVAALELASVKIGTKSLATTVRRLTRERLKSLLKN